MELPGPGGNRASSRNSAEVMGGAQRGTTVILQAIQAVSAMFEKCMYMVKEVGHCLPMHDIGARGPEPAAEPRPAVISDGCGQSF
jgi:hypothetical protein